MAHSFLLSHSRETGHRKLWRWSPDDAKAHLEELELPDEIAKLDAEYLSTTVGSYVLYYKPPSSVTLGESAYVDFRLWQSYPTGHHLLFILSQQGSWYWDKFTGDYSYTDAVGGPQITDLSLTGITGYVLSRLPTPGRSSFGLWNFDAYNDATQGSQDPIKVSMADPDAFPTVGEDELLVPIGNDVMVVNQGTGTYRLFSFDPQLPNPLSYPAIGSGVLEIEDHSHLLVVAGQLVAWTPGKREHIVFEYLREAPFSKPKKGQWPEGFACDAGSSLQALSPPAPAPEKREGAKADAALPGTPGTMDFMRQNIKHVVYYVLESRSFDSVVGWLYDQTSAANINWVGATASPPFKGASTSNYNEDSTGAKFYQNQYQGGAVGTTFKLDTPVLDPFHGTPDAIRQQWKGGYATYQAGQAADMAGFVLNNANDQIMATYSPAQLGILNGLAQWYGVSDYWFSSEAGGTTTNRATMATGSALDITTSYEGGDAYTYFPMRQRRQSIWKVLANHAIMDWAIYYSVLWEGFPYTYHLWLEGQLPSVDAYSGQYVRPVASFFTDAANGTLPAFCFLEPVWYDPSGVFTSYHPTGDVLPGEQALQNIFNALSSSPNWNETVLVVSFSKGGGMYDHEPSQFMTKAWPNDGNDGYTFNTTGTRVPTLVISPLVAKNTVFRSNDTNTPYDATSLAATVLSWFGVPKENWGMGDRVDEAPTFESVFTLSTPRTDLPTLTRGIDETYPTQDPIPVAAPSPVSATWQNADGTGTWTWYGNWQGGNLPTDVATFGANGSKATNNTINFTFVSPQTVNEISFVSGAPAYTLLFDEEQPAAPTLSIMGAGVTNSSGQPQTFNVQATSTSNTQVQLAFMNTANAGDSSISYIVGPTTPDSQSGGVITFNQRASAGSANFSVSVGSRRPGHYSTVGAEVRFLHFSTAATASFTVTGTTGAEDTDTFGNVVFHNYAKAASASFTNVGGTVGDGGNTQFFEQTSAENATIINQGATGPSGNGGDTAFDGIATAGNAKITNHAATVGNGGVTSFNNNYPYMAPISGANAGNATIENMGVKEGQSGSGGHTEFTGIYGSANAGTATIDNYGGAVPGSSGGGYTLFAVNGRWPYYQTNARAAKITNHPAVVANAQSGQTSFTFLPWEHEGDKSVAGPSAATSTITNLGGTVPGCAGGSTIFDYEATAGYATISATGGLGGEPGTIQFSRNADGGSASITLSGGLMDVTASTRSTLNLGTLTVANGSISMQVGGTTPVITVATTFTLQSAPLTFTLTGTTQPTANVPLLKAPQVAGMQNTQFTGTYNGSPINFAVSGDTVSAVFT